jgi:tRNA(His) guanylyltransferase
MGISIGISDKSFSRAHGFAKPNDIDALNLMNTAAKAIMRELTSDITLAYGDSDEYRYLPVTG